MEEWKSSNRVCEHTAKLMANNEHTDQRNKICAKICAETLQHYAPFLNSMVSGGGQRNGTWDPSGFVSNLCRNNFAASPFPMQPMKFQMPQEQM